MSKKLFDDKTGMLLLDEYVYEMPSFKRIMEDGVITSDEAREQSQKVIGLLRKLEEVLEPDKRELLIEALCEVAVLYAISRKAE